jgi:hypothetical protein
MDVMVNRGVAPADSSTPIGQLRNIIGDVAYTELDPVEPGFGNYAAFSDDQLQSFLDLGTGNLAYGVGYAYTTLAAQFAADAIKVTTDDEAIDLTQRAESMRKIANDWFNRGDANAAANDTYFSIVYPEYECGSEFPPELSIGTIDWWE